MTMVHLFGGVSSPCCANFALRKTTDNNEDYGPESMNTVKQNLYIDDCLKSIQSGQIAISHLKNLFSLLTYLMNQARQVFYTNFIDENSVDQ